MHLGIRAKLVGTLLLAGLLPLALALGIILFGAVELRISSQGRLYRALAQQQANHLSNVLASQVEFVNLFSALPDTREYLEQANQIPPLTPDQIQQIEAGWPTLKVDQQPLKKILENPVARHWQTVNREQRRFSEVMVTDASGRLVAATNKTSDFFQADEKWWTDCFDQGRGRVLISDIIFDESAISPEGRRGTLVADLCVPVYTSIRSPDRKVIGIVKVSIDARWILDQIELGMKADELPRATWLVRADGKSVPGASPAPPVAALPPSVTRRFMKNHDGWVLDRDVPGFELIGFAEVDQSRMMEDRAEHWHVIIASSRHDVVRTIHNMAWTIFLLGMLIIAAFFVGGLFIARREMIRPVVTLRNAVEALKAGNRDFRIPVERGRKETFRDDELGQLAGDFNLMAEQLKRNFEQIEQQDAIKRQFIDLASHELRTPVTYIQGVSQLAQRQLAAGENGSPSGAAQAAVMAKIASKAARLNRIVENMFKLLASDHFEKNLKLTQIDVSAMIHTVVAELDPFLKERHQSWKLDIAQNLPLIQGEGEKIRDIVANLLSNAIRFSPDGGIVHVAAQQADDDIRITVADQGPGIPAADLPNLFQPFFTGAAVAQHSSGEFQHMSRGIGLGLSVVKRFVELHGGAVRVDTSSAGTKMIVTLPVRPKTAQPPAATMPKTTTSYENA